MFFIFGRFQGFGRPQTLRKQAGMQHIQDAHLLLNEMILLYSLDMNEPWIMVHLNSIASTYHKIKIVGRL